MARSIDQVQGVHLPVGSGITQSRRLGLDGDAALTLDVHRIQNLGFHFAGLQAPATLDQAVGQGRFAVIDVRNDGKVADVVHRDR